MAHIEQRRFVERCHRWFPDHFRGARVLEIGSRNVNGSIRDLFINCQYVGIDAVEGPGVDRVMLAHEVTDEVFDVVCSCEAFEHDPHVARSIVNTVAMLRGGGLFFGSCAGPKRREHGTRRSGGEEYGPDAEYYGNLDFRTFGGILSAAADWRMVHLEYGRADRDLYWYAIKS